MIRRRLTAPALQPRISLTQAMSDPQLFGNVFASPTYWTWRTIAKLVDGLPLTEPREVRLFQECTGRTRLPTQPVRRLYILAGRRAGKDRFASALAIWRCALCADWRQHISAGEGAVAALLSVDRTTSAILRNYCEGLLHTPLLAREVVRRTNEVIEFRNGSSLEISTNDARLVRGRSAIAVLGSETAHWRTDERAASNDEETIAAALPSLAMCPDGGLLVLGSSVARKAGLMFRKYKELFGNDDAEDVVWFAPSTVMNPRLPQSIIDKALADDPARARAEFENVWREDLSDFIPADVIAAATDFAIHERAPQRGVKYFAHVDAAAGTGSESFALAVAHRQDASVQLDLLRERRPRFVPAEVIDAYSALLKNYGVTEVQGDKYAGAFHSEEWKRHGITFKPCPRTTSDNYLALLPALLAGRVRPLDNKTLRTQLASLERRVGINDREIVDHPVGAGMRDDIACAAAGALVGVLNRPTFHWDAMTDTMSDEDPLGIEAWRRLRYAMYLNSSGRVRL